MKILMKIILAVSLSIGMVGNTVAEPAFYKCDVIYVGPHANGNQYIKLTCPSTGTKSWHIIHPNIGNPGMAVALTAMSLGSSVTAYIDPLAPYSDMTAIYLNSQ